MKMSKWAAAVATTALCVTALAGCSSPGKTTCSEYAEKGISERQSAITRMIEDKGFDPYSSVWGTVGIQTRVSEFCGIPLMGGKGATKNEDTAIEEAIDWDKVGRK